MLKNYEYYTIESASKEGIFKDKGSKFIAKAFPLQSQDFVKMYLALIKKEYPAARHYCYAWRIGLDGSNFRSNDDGEPSGSAGNSILSVLNSNNITNVIIIVTRYFGGSLLGIPGLKRAYKTAALYAVNQSIILKKSILHLYCIKFDYMLISDVMQVLKDKSVHIKKQLFDENCYIEYELDEGSLLHINGILKKLNLMEIRFLDKY